MAAALTPETIQKYQRKFESDPKNRLAQNVCTKQDPLEVCLLRPVLDQTNHVFTHKIETEGKPITNQKNSGRCWIFACLNVLRIPMMKQYQLEEFEFSQAYLFFWDKIERSNYFLNNIVNTARRGEPVDGRLVSFLLQNPVCDGGQWDMLVNLITKYGLVPKKCFPDTVSCETSSRMNSILTSKLREYARDLRELLNKGVSDADIQMRIDEMLEQIYCIVSICLGTPPPVITWEYYNKNKAYCSIGPVSPKEFYEEYVKPYYNVEDKFCFVNDPRPESGYGRALTVDCLGNMIGGRKTVYNNQPVELLMEYVVESIKTNEPIWFGCEVAKRFAVKQGIEDLSIHDYELVFGTNVSLGLSKAERLLYGESLMTHAMVFTAVTVDADNKPVKFRVENSWGDDRGDKGYLVMTKEWFQEFMFEVVVDRKFISPEVMAVFDEEPKVLPAWDPMGALAMNW